jgi:hypothetical protein
MCFYVLIIYINVFHKRAPHPGERPIIAGSPTAQPQHVMS